MKPKKPRKIGKTGLPRMMPDRMAAARALVLALREFRQGRLSKELRQFAKDLLLELPADRREFARRAMTNAIAQGKKTMRGSQED